MLAKLSLAAVLSWLGWQAIVNTAADNLAGSAPNDALTWRSNHSGALVELAQRQFDDEASVPDLALIADAAERALQRNALDLEALRILAHAAEVQGDDNKAEALYRLAGQRSQQDLRTLSWTLDHLLSKGDIPGSIVQVDLMLRVSPDLRSSLFPLLASLADFPEGLDPLIAFLRTDPPWRLWFTTNLIRESQILEGLQALYDGLEEDAQDEEVRAYLVRLVQLGHYRIAHDVWTGLSSDAARPGTSLIHNGGFEQPVIGLPFEWNLGDIRGAKVDIVTDEGGNRRLKVEFYNTEVPFRHVSQLLLLEPGRYRLEGEAQLADLENERGLQWTIACARAPGEVIAETERLRGTLSPKGFETLFVVPDDPNCEAQALTLILAARVPAEQLVSGEAWFDSLRISRV